MTKEAIKREILRLSWFEHSKGVDELHKIYGPTSPKIIELKKELKKIQEKIHSTKPFVLLEPEILNFPMSIKSYG